MCIIVRTQTNVTFQPQLARSAVHVEHMKFLFHFKEFESKILQLYVDTYCGDVCYGVLCEMLLQYWTEYCFFVDKFWGSMRKIIIYVTRGFSFINIHQHIWRWTHVRCQPNINHRPRIKHTQAFWQMSWIVNYEM